MSGRDRIWRAGLVGIMLIVHFALLWWAATANSVTCDEYANLPAGLAHWRTGDMSIYCLSPPLLRMWSAIPLLARTKVLPNDRPLGEWREAARNEAAMGRVVVPPPEAFAALPLEARHWNYGGYFQDFNAANYPSLFVAARMMTILLSCAMAVIVYFWAKELHGAVGGLMACGVYCLCPNIAAHGSLVTTEMGAVLTIVSASWLWWRFGRRPTAGRLLLAAFVTGVAHLCKFNAILLWPIIFAFLLWGWRRGEIRGRRIAIALVAAGAVTLLLVNSVFRFDGFGSRIRDYAFKSAALTGISRWAGWVPLPFPRDYILGFDAQKAELELGSPSYFLGEVYTGARWVYYPVLLACKLPIAILGLMVVAVIAAIVRRKEKTLWGGWPPLLCAAMVVAGMMMANINMGLRYALAALPFLYIAMASVWQPIIRWNVAAASLILVGLVAENLSAAPRYLTFYNVVAGGPANGWRIASETYDWGQGLLDLKKWMGEKNVGALSLAYFGRVDPTVYGIKYRLVTAPEPLEYVAVSTYFLDGLWYMLPTPNGPTPRFRIPFFEDLRQTAPAGIAGSTLYIYRREDFLAAKRRYEEKVGHAVSYYF